MNSQSEYDKIYYLLERVKNAYENGENAMALARRLMDGNENDKVATLLSYDMQSGSYINAVKAQRKTWQMWCNQLASLVQPLLHASGTLLEVGCGECTTMSGVVKQLSGLRHFYGFDISWSRVNAGIHWLSEMNLAGTIFVADLFRIPIADNSVDIVYSSHSLEPNGGREEEAIRECLRVARDYVVLVEPIYELANDNQRQRMREHGYVRGLRDAAVRIGADIVDYRLLDFTTNPLNPSGVLVIRKKKTDTAKPGGIPVWMCPLTRADLRAASDVYINDKCGLVYPVIRNIPMLRVEHVIVASKIGI